MKGPKRIIRQATEEDLPFIYSSWLRSFRQAVDQNLVSDHTFFRVKHDDFERLLQRNRLVICGVPGDKEVILGWACGGEDLLHYVYVKRDFRHLGISLELLDAFLEAQTVWYTHHGPGAESYIVAVEQARDCRLRFCPGREM